MLVGRLPASIVQSVQCCCFARSRKPQWPLRQRFIQQPSSRLFSASSQMTAISAPEIDFNADNETKDFHKINARLSPGSASYFTGSPQFIDHLLSLQALLRKHETLPILPPDQTPRASWRTLIEYRNIVGESVKAAKYQNIIRVLHRLNQIYPSVMPNEVKVALSSYRRDINPQMNAARRIHIDRFGRALAVGRRKSSVARAYVIEGNGEMLINGKSLVEAFGRVHDRESAIWALKATERVDKYNVWALVDGGGTTGQAEALTLAIAKALLAHEPLLKPALRRAGCITRDPRRVERKKPGRVKARKMPTWVKR